MNNPPPSSVIDLLRRLAACAIALALWPVVVVGISAACAGVFWVGYVAIASWL